MFLLLLLQIVETLFADIFCKQPNRYE